jgi:branched-chain amino acid transport system substrate-binding protein
VRIKHLGTGLVVALISVGGLAACGGDDDDNGSAAATTTSVSPAPSSSGTTTSSSTASGQIDPSKPTVNLAFIGIKIPGINLFDGMTRGAKAAVKKLNDEGGFGGRKVVLDTCNSMAQPAIATVCAQKTLAKKPIAEFGCEIAWGASGLKAYARAKVPSFNCSSLPVDFTNPYSYAIHPGTGDQALGRWICAQPNIKTVSYLTQDIPQQHKTVAAQTIPAIKACGKTVSPIYYPITAADLTPQIQQVVAKKADFNFINTSGPQTVAVLKGYQAAGIPGNKIMMRETSWDYGVVVKPAGSALEGAYYFGGFRPWGETTDPDVKGYLAAMQAAGYPEGEVKDPSAGYGYAEAMFFYAAAKEIGFDQFDSTSLKQFMDTNNTLKMPLGRTLVNPGPKGFPQVKQPYSHIAQYKGGAFTPVTEGTDDGWVNAY